MKRIRRFIWYLASRLLLVLILLSVSTVTFYYAMNASNIYPQLLTIEAAHTGKRDLIYQAAMMDPVTGAQLSTDEIVSMCNDLIEAHTNAGFPIIAK